MKYETPQELSCGVYLLKEGLRMRFNLRLPYYNNVEKYNKYNIVKPKKLKEFTCGYEVYARNSEFVNKFLFYYGNKNGIETNLSKADDYDEISKFLRYGNGIKEYLQNSTDCEPLAFAKMLVED